MLLVLYFIIQLKSKLWKYNERNVFYQRALEYCKKFDNYGPWKSKLDTQSR